LLSVTYQVTCNGVVIDPRDYNFRFLAFLRFGRTPVPVPEPGGRLHALDYTCHDHFYSAAELAQKAAEVAASLAEASTMNASSDETQAAAPTAASSSTSTGAAEAEPDQPKSKVAKTPAKGKKGKLASPEADASSALMTLSGNAASPSSSSSSVSASISSSSSSAATALSNQGYSVLSFRVNRDCLSEGGLESTVRLRLLLLHPSRDDVAISWCDSHRWAIMTKSLPSDQRLSGYMARWGFPIHPEDPVLGKVFVVIRFLSFGVTTLKVNFSSH
jgi:hypothetical protein